MTQPNVEAVLADLGARIRRLRITAGLTQQELADQANLSRRTVSALENGSGSSLESLVRVLRVLGAVDWIARLAPPAAEFDPFEVLAAEQRKVRSRVRR